MSWAARETPNDPKLSDGGGWRGCCGKAAGARWAKVAGWCVAAAVTAGAVRCSAWLDAVDSVVLFIRLLVIGILIQCWIELSRLERRLNDRIKRLNDGEKQEGNREIL